jgi:diaminopimelate decarboxylase
LLFAEHECSILCGFNDEYCGAYVYKDATKILDFLPALSPMIFAKYCKKAVRSEVMGTIQSISLSRAHGDLLLNQNSVIYTYSMSSRY